MRKRAGRIELISTKCSLLAVVAVVVAGVGCSDGLPECVDGSPPGETDGPRLSGPPSFSESEIAPGDDLVLSVPVNAQTRHVSAGYQTEDFGGGETMETTGGTTVEFVFGGPRTPDLLFWNGSIALGDERTRDAVVYVATEDLTAYEFSFEAGEGFIALCRTPFAPPTFMVVE